MKLGFEMIPVLPVKQDKKQVAYYLRRNARPFIERLMNKYEGTEELNTLLKPDFQIKNLKVYGYYDYNIYSKDAYVYAPKQLTLVDEAEEWSTRDVPKIKSSHLKGSKLRIYGTLDW